jgi:hypothetical protein
VWAGRAGRAINHDNWAARKPAAHHLLISEYQTLAHPSPMGRLTR